MCILLKRHTIYDTIYNLLVSFCLFLFLYHGRELPENHRSPFSNSVIVCSFYFCTLTMTTFININDLHHFFFFLFYQLIETHTHTRTCTRVHESMYVLSQPLHLVILSQVPFAPGTYLRTFYSAVTDPVVPLPPSHSTRTANLRPHNHSRSSLALCLYHPRSKVFRKMWCNFSDPRRDVSVFQN